MAGGRDMDDSDFNFTSNQSYSSAQPTPYRTFYLICIPLLIVTAFVAFLINSYILLSSRWIRKKMSPNLKLSISLAAADAYTSVLMAVGLMVNSYVPIALGNPLMELNCFRLFLESLRLGAIETSVIHLLFLSLNQLLSIRYPLQYGRLISTRKVTWVLVCIWGLPTVAVSIYFAITTGHQGYLDNCWSEAFIRLQFRLFVFLLVFIPFTLLMVIYVLLLLSLKQFQARRGSQAAQRSNCLAASQLKRSYRMATTTSLIIGTFAIGWLPGAVLLAIVCLDCLVSPAQIDQSYLVATATSFNVLMLLKLLLNPLVYAYRILEIRFALWLMHTSRWGLRREQQNLYRSVPDEFQKLSSAGSSLQSTRRPRIIEPQRTNKVPMIKKKMESDTTNGSKITFDATSDTFL